MENLPPLEKKLIIFENRFRDWLELLSLLSSSNLSWPFSKKNKINKHLVVISTHATDQQQAPILTRELQHIP